MADAAEQVDPQVEAVEMMAEAKRLKAEGERLEKIAKERILDIHKETRLRTLTAPIGVVTVTDVAGAKRFNKDRARQFMTFEQWDSCHELGTPSIKVQFFPSKG